MSTDPREDIETLYARAVKCASRHGRNDIARDFAAWATTRWLEGKSQHQLIIHTFYDYCDAFLKKDSRKDAMSRSNISIEELHSPPPSLHDDEKLRSFERMLCRHYPLRLDRAVAVLFAKWGFSLEEIADVVGLTPRRVNQILMRPRSKIPPDESE